MFILHRYLVHWHQITKEILNYCYNDYIFLLGTYSKQILILNIWLEYEKRVVLLSFFSSYIDTTIKSYLRAQDVQKRTRRCSCMCRRDESGRFEWIDESPTFTSLLFIGGRRGSGHLYVISWESQELLLPFGFKSILM